MADDSQKKVSFRAKTLTKCPVCGAEHAREELLSGGGRLIAGKLTQELRRLFEESKKWGRIYPMAYALSVCPRCLFTAFPKDFESLTPEEVQAMKAGADHRRKLIQTVFGPLNFEDNRNLINGAASYMLAVDCYHLRNKNVAPTPKKAVCSIRAAWLLGDLFREAPERPFDKAAEFYYLESFSAYRKTIELMQNGAEPVEANGYVLGPDVDHNWGFDGINYLNAYLTMKYVDKLAPDLPGRLKLLEDAKRFLSKLYGMGKSSKTKPSAIIDISKDLYEEMGRKIDELNATVV